MASIFAAVGLIVNLIIQIHVIHYSSPSNEDKIMINVHTGTFNDIFKGTAMLTYSKTLW